MFWPKKKFGQKRKKNKKFCQKHKIKNFVKNVKKKFGLNRKSFVKNQSFIKFRKKKKFAAKK